MINYNQALSLLKTTSFWVNLFYNFTRVKKVQTRDFVRLSLKCDVFFSLFFVVTFIFCNWGLHLIQMLISSKIITNKLIKKDPKLLQKKKNIFFFFICRNVLAASIMWGLFLSMNNHMNVHRYCHTYLLLSNLLLMLWACHLLIWMLRVRIGL